MAELEVSRLDVFTEDLLSGNPTWVVYDADDLEEAIMQRLAFELGPPSTAFVLKSKRADARMRFFNTQSEDPISGHAAVGALWSLAEKGYFGGTFGGKQRLETPIGILPFSIDLSDDGSRRVWMSQKKPLFAKVDELKETASALGIGADAIFHEGFPLSKSSTGLPCLLVPIRSMETMTKLAVREKELIELSTELDVMAVVAYTWSVIDPSSTVHVRCFVPHPWVQEDVASGMPAGALAAYLVENELLPREKSGDIIVEQGHIMGRPSKILVRVERHGSTIRKVEVGGRVRSSMRGKVMVP